VSTVEIRTLGSEGTRTAELPDEVFDVPANVPLLHQVVVAQLAARRSGTHSTKTRGEVRGGGAKPYRQKGTGRARQGSTRAPQFTGGGTVFGPTPRDYSQKTPKKMKAAALRGALSDRARNGRVHVVDRVVEGGTPSTSAAVQALAAVSDRRHVLVVAERTDEVTWKSLRNASHVHLIAPGQLNTYDVLVSDDVVFTEAALAAFLAGSPASKTRRPKGSAVTSSSDSEQPDTSPATDAGSTTAAGEGVDDREMTEEVAGATDPNLAAEDTFEREADGAATETEAAKADADELEDRP
jgi:large subunit ribosomal protein L4